MTPGKIASFLLFTGLIVLGITGENECQGRLGKDFSSYTCSYERPAQVTCVQQSPKTSVKRNHDRW